ncbi:MAG: hypothetical protein GX811_08430, partial [Lentisphaerae bacterium]|nr:hypothetical protein [Lentisphaerota bacterium]
MRAIACLIYRMFFVTGLAGLVLFGFGCMDPVSDPATKPASGYEDGMADDRAGDSSNDPEVELITKQETDPDIQSTGDPVLDRLASDPLMVPYYTGKVLPTPQKVVYRDEYFPLKRVAVVVGDDLENPVPIIAILRERIEQYGGQVRVTRNPPDNS